MSVPRSIRGFPNEPMYSHLLRLSKETQHIIIHDPKNGANVTCEEFLLDVLAFQSVLRQAIPNECFEQSRNNDRSCYVAVLCPMSYEFIVSLYAINSLGFAVVPLSTKLLPDEVAELMCICDAICLVTASDQSALATKIPEKGDIFLGKNTVHVPVSVKPGMRKKIIDLGGAFIEENVSFPHLRPGLLIFTSGTTGPPKGVVHTREFFNPRSIRGAKLGGRALYQRPTHSITGVLNLMDLISTGACVEIFPTGYDAASIWERLAAGGITILFGPPVMWTLLMQYYEEKLRHLPSSKLSRYMHGIQTLQVAWMGAGLATSRVKRFWLEILKGGFQIKYSSTEMGREVLFYEMNATSDPSLPVIGKPVFGVDVKLTHVDHGELLVKAPNMFQGYLNDKDKTRDAFTEAGYYKTGDLAHVDKNGVFLFQGRASADFARFSTYIVPILEVEAALVSLPYIAEGYILPVPDDMHGHLIGALVRLKPETCLDMLPLTLATLRSDLSLSISLYKQPTLLRVVVDEEIPLSGQGKLARNKAIEMYFTSSTGLCYLQKWDLTLEMRRPGKKAWDWGGITL